MVEEKEFMARILYASVIDSLISTMICTRTGTSHVNMLSRYLNNPSKEH